MSTTPDGEPQAPGESAPAFHHLVPPEAFSGVRREWSREIIATMDPDSDWAIIGVKRRGAVLSERLRKDVEAAGKTVEYGEVDIALYRDDFHLDASPQVHGTEIDFSVEDKSILLVDDVLSTGRTVRAALNVILDFGRPKKIFLAVLVDRGADHRELPIAANFVGAALRTESDDRVQVRLVEMGDPADSVDLQPHGLARKGLSRNGRPESGPAE